MSDLVEQLRRNANDCEDDARWATPELAPLLRKAADEIERLSGEVARYNFCQAMTGPDAQFKAAIWQAEATKYAKEADAARAHVERLTKALEIVATHPEKSEPGANPSYGMGWVFYRIRDVARAALAPQDQQPSANTADEGDRG